MGKKLLVLALATVMILGVLGLSGCSQISIVYAYYNGDYGEYEPLQLVMNAGETHTITTNHFRGLDIEFDKFEFIDNSRNNPSVFNPNAVTMSDNVITAQHNGFVNVYAYLYEKEVILRVKYAWCVLVAQIQVVNIDEMTEITSAQELQDMNLDLDGHYILRANIDLAGFDWMPIIGYGSPSINYNNISFRGSFINPDGFVIKNLTSNMSGLFGYTYRAYIEGIILENVNIDAISDYIDVTDVTYLCRAGGISGYAMETVILNCKVEGSIKALHNAGGIVGYGHSSVIRNCEFSGIVEATYKINLFNSWASAGGIIGDFDAFLQDSLPVYLTVGIFDCKVNAEIISVDFAGGIVGYNYGDSKPKDCIFVGTPQGAKGQGEMYGYSRY